MERGIGEHPAVYALLLQRCSSLKALTEGKRVHAHIIKTGVKPNNFLSNSLLNMYVECGSVVDARRVFDNMLERDVTSWTAIMAGYACHGLAEEAIKIFWQMQLESVMPTKATFITVLRACTRLASLEHGKQIHSYISKSGFQLDVFVGSTLIDMYAKCWTVVDARHVFDNMPERSVVTWNAMIAGYVQHGYGVQALRLFQQMQDESVKPVDATFVSTLKACANLASVEHGKHIHAHIMETGFESDVIVGNALVDMYVKCGRVVDAFQLFKKMPERDVVSWTSMIVGYTQHGFSEEALNIFWQMLQECMKPDYVVCISVLKACANIGALEQGRQIHACIIKGGFEIDAFVGSALVD
eukprot:c15083_g1_i1 orf=1-1065(-)